jgi:hypothetical protein
MDSIKTLHQAKTADIDKVLLGWFMQYLDEKFPLCHYLSLAKFKCFMSNFTCHFTVHITVGSSVDFN